MKSHGGAGAFPSESYAGKETAGCCRDRQRRRDHLFLTPAEGAVHSIHCTLSQKGAVPPVLLPSSPEVLPESLFRSCLAPTPEP